MNTCFDLNNPSEDLLVLNRNGGNSLGAGSTIQWTEEQINFIILHYKKYCNIKLLSSLFKTSQGTIHNLLKRLGIETKLTSEKAKELYPRNSLFFEKIDTPTKAYWLGFLYADGYVNTKNNIIRINLKRTDEEHLRKFLKAIEASNTKVKYATKMDGDAVYEGCYVTICDKQLAADLEQLGCVQKKSLKLTFPSEQQVPQELLSHFIRGYFDGDGSIWYKVHPISHLKYFNLNMLGTFDFLSGIQKFLHRTHCKLEKNHNHYVLHVCGNGVVEKVLKILYEDSTSDIELSRKRDKYDELILQRQDKE